MFVHTSTWGVGVGGTGVGGGGTEVGVGIGVGWGTLQLLFQVACPCVVQFLPLKSQKPGGIISFPFWCPLVLWSPPPLPSTAFQSTVSFWYGFCWLLVAWQIVTCVVALALPVTKKKKTTITAITPKTIKAVIHGPSIFIRGVSCLPLDIYFFTPLYNHNVCEIK